MPPLPSVPGVVQLAVGVSNSHSGHVDINRFHFHYTGTAPTSGELNSFATTALTAYGSAFGPSMTSDKDAVSIDAIDLTSPTGASAVVIGSTAGTLATTAMPADASVVMSLTIGRRYRGGHPRLYLPCGSVETMHFTNQWATAFLATLTTAAAGFFTAVNGAGWTGAGTIGPVNVSYYHGSLPVTYPGGRVHNVPQLRVGGPLVDPVTGFVMRVPIGSQRRRLAA